jgi:hypothetical protein
MSQRAAGGCEMHFTPPRPSTSVCALSRRPLLRVVARLLLYLERCGVAVTARADCQQSSRPKVQTKAYRQRTGTLAV